MGKHRQVGLDAVRGIAILLVLLFHFDQPVGIGALDAALAPLRAAGWVGVELFFVLSGYLVGGIILRQSAAPDGFDWRNFALRRALRLWPMLYLYVAALALAGLAWDAIWPVLLHVQNYSDSARSHLWSLAVEEHFYLLAGVTLPWLVRTTSPRRILGLLVGLIILVNVLRGGAVAAGVPWHHIHWQTLYRIDALAAGVSLAVVRIYWPAVFAAVQQQRWPLVLSGILGLGIVALKLEFLTRWSGDLTVAWLAAVPLVIAASDLNIRGALAWPANRLAALGRIAYPLYIWHFAIGSVAVMLADQAGIADPLALAGVRWSSAIAFAWLLHRSVELPFLAMRERPAAPAQNLLHAIPRATAVSNSNARSAG